MGKNQKPNDIIGRNGKKKYKNGTYIPLNKDKYIGDLTKVYYRSSWELRFMQYLDVTSEILRWSCEEIKIPYRETDGSYHTYYPDFYFERVDKNNPQRFDRVVIEIKPRKDRVMPKEPEKFTPIKLESYEYQLKMYQKNLYKWSRATDFCKKNGMKFYIMDEFDLMKYGILEKPKKKYYKKKKK